MVHPDAAGRHPHVPPRLVNGWSSGDLAAHLAAGASLAVFDLGGVLLQGGVLAAATEREFFAALDPDWDIDPAAAWEVWAALLPGAETGAIPESRIWEEIAALAGGHRPDPRVLRRLFLAAGSPVPAATGLLERLRGLHCPVAIASNHTDAWMREWTRRYPWLREIGGQGRIYHSQGFGVRKPDPRFFQALTGALGTADAWFLDDREENARAACEAGLKGLLVRPACAWEVAGPGPGV